MRRCSTMTEFGDGGASGAGAEAAGLAGLAGPAAGDDREGRVKSSRGGVYHRWPAAFAMRSKNERPPSAPKSACRF